MKKKNNPLAPASINNKPLFHNIKAPAVDTAPKYTTEPTITGFNISSQGNALTVNTLNGAKQTIP